MGVLAGSGALAAEFIVGFCDRFREGWGEDKMSSTPLEASGVEDVVSRKAFQSSGR